MGKKVAPFIGAHENEVVVTDSTGLNLYKVLAAALDLNPDRSVIVMEGSNFPTDNYMAQGLIKQLGGRHEIRFAEIDTILDSIDEDVAAVQTDRQEKGSEPSSLWSSKREPREHECERNEYELR